MRFELMHPADQLVLIMDRIYSVGMTTTSGGNLSIRDDNGDVWITPSGVDKGTLTRRDIMCIHPDGSMEGVHRPSVELPFHQDIYKKRPDIGAIVHAHPPALVAFSLTRTIPKVGLVPNVRGICGKVGMAEYEVPGSAELGSRIAEQFEQGCNTVVLENHGAVVGAPDLFHAFMAFETMDFCARLEIDAHKLGEMRTLSDREIDLTEQKKIPNLDAFLPARHSSEERAARYEMCTLIHRAYDQKLFSSTQGTFSVRLSDGSFLITPYQKDRKYLEAEDIVRIKGGMCEANKIPSRSVALHEQIYKRHPELGSVIIAHPPSIMAFAVTDATFDSRTIPESYIMLRDVKKLPYGSSFLDVEGTVNSLSLSCPVIMVENDCMIVVGNTLLNAFDRLEVAEYSARAVLAAMEIGEIVKINDEQIETIKKDFNLT